MPTFGYWQLPKIMDDSESSIATALKQMKELGHNGLRIGDDDEAFHSLDFLENMPALETLSVSGLTQELSVLEKLPHLKNLQLVGIKGVDLRILEPIDSLDEVVIRNSIFKSTQIEKLSCKLLIIMNTKGMRDGLNLGQINRLESLDLTNCRDMTTLPDFSTAKCLSFISLSDLPKLLSIEPLLQCTSLNALALQNLRSLKPEDLQCLLEHPTLEHVYPPIKSNSPSVKKSVIALLKPRFPDVFDFKKFPFPNSR